AISTNIVDHMASLRPFLGNSHMMGLLWPAIFAAARVAVPEPPPPDTSFEVYAWPIIESAIGRARHFLTWKEVKEGMRVRLTTNPTLLRFLCSSVQVSVCGVIELTTHPGVCLWSDEFLPLLGQVGTVLTNAERMGYSIVEFQQDGLFHMLPFLALTPESGQS
ncbi:unnamed protein product, partial [Polarella glacialis]